MFIFCNKCSRYMGQEEPLDKKEGKLYTCSRCKGLCPYCGTNLEVEREVFKNKEHTCRGGEGDLTFSLGLFTM